MNTKEIQDRLDKASEGPWEWVGDDLEASNNGGAVLYVEDRPVHAYSENQTGELDCSVRNRDFIAHAPADIKALLAEVKKLEELVKWALSRACNKCSDFKKSVSNATLTQKSKL